jgi:hypothetical protein
MLLYGIHLDQVIDVASVMGAHREYEKVESWTSDVVTTVRKHVEKATFENIAAVLIAGRNVDLKRATQEDTRGFVDLLQALSKDHKVPQFLRRTTPSTSDEERARARFWTQMVNTCVKRRVLVTKTGYIGVGPKLTRAGDHVVVLYGGRTPFVLRPHQNEYRLVGECYVHGVMDGEAMRRHKDSGNPDAEFRIR